MTFQGLPQSHFVSAPQYPGWETKHPLSSSKFPTASSGFWKGDSLTSDPEPSDGAESCLGQVACKSRFPHVRADFLPQDPCLLGHRDSYNPSRANETSLPAWKWTSTLGDSKIYSEDFKLVDDWINKWIKLDR